MAVQPDPVRLPNTTIQEVSQRTPRNWKKVRQAQAKLAAGFFPRRPANRPSYHASPTRNKKDSALPLTIVRR